jgi:hypothetical protein
VKRLSKPKRKQTYAWPSSQVDASLQAGAVGEKFLHGRLNIAEKNGSASTPLEWFGNID